MFLENWFYRKIGGQVLSLWQSAKPCSRSRISCVSHRRIFCFNPTKQRAAFFGVGRYECDASWRRQKGDGGRVNNLEDIKTKGMSHERKQQESCEHPPVPPRGLPAKEQRFGRNLRGK